MHSGMTVLIGGPDAYLKAFGGTAAAASLGISSLLKSLTAGILRSMAKESRGGGRMSSPTQSQCEASFTAKAGIALILSPKHALFEQCTSINASTFAARITAMARHLTQMLATCERETSLALALEGISASSSESKAGCNQWPVDDATGIRCHGSAMEFAAASNAVFCISLLSA